MENGVADEIDNAQPYFPPRNDANHAQSPPTQLLVLLGPMSPVGRAVAYRALLNALEAPMSRAWSLSVLDDAGDNVPHGISGQDLSGGVRRARDAYRPQLNSNDWYTKAVRAIRELGTLPGRHAIIFISDPQGVSPMLLVRAAVTVRAPMYVWRASGPLAIPPVGEAASQNGLATGPLPFVTGENAQLVFSSELAQRGYSDSVRADFATAAGESGGVEIRDLGEAFHRLVADTAGYYLIDFKAHPADRGSVYHPLEVSARNHHFTVAGPHLYVAAPEVTAPPISPEMRDAVRAMTPERSLSLAANGWLFPVIAGIHLAVFSVDLDWPQGGAHPPGAQIRLLAELTDESMQSVVARWNETLASPRDVHLHWQREVHLYPGFYTMRVVAQDSQSGRVGTAIYTLAVRPTMSNALRFSALVIAAECLDAAGLEAQRRDLLDPMRVGNCTLAPRANLSFRSGQTVRMMLRIYPPDQKFSSMILRNWKPFARVQGDDSEIPLEVVADPVRGLIATATLQLSDRITTGVHQLDVIFSFKDQGQQKRTIAFRNEFTVEPAH